MPSASVQNTLVLGSLKSYSLSKSVFISIVSLAASVQVFVPPTGDSQSWQKSKSKHPRIDRGPAPSPEDGPPGARHALRNSTYLSAQIGGIIGSNIFSLVVVAIIILCLSKKRREHLRAARNENLVEWASVPTFRPLDVNQEASLQSLNQACDQSHCSAPFQHLAPSGHARNLFLPAPMAQNFSPHRFSASSYISHKSDVQTEPTSSSSCLPSFVSTTRGPLGQSSDVEQGTVRKDRAMAQTQLEQMYKYVMEQEDAKEAGVEFHAPMTVDPPRQQHQHQHRNFSSGLRKEKKKPASLNICKGEKTQSRASSILSALKSPLVKKKPHVQGMDISLPIMTPMLSTFPARFAGEEISSIQPRQNAPARPPPVPVDSTAGPGPAPASFSQRRNTGHIAPLTPPDLSLSGAHSIDGRLGATAAVRSQSRYARSNGDVAEEDAEEQRIEQGAAQPPAIATNTAHSRSASATTNTEADPMSAVSEPSQAPLVAAIGPLPSGVPTSPEPDVNRFPSLTASPKRGAGFSRPNAPSAVRTGGTLPLRAYAPALISPGTYDRTVKQTVFERSGPMSPGGMHAARTPIMGNPVPYSPYQPFSPVVPITPILVTRADRKRMKKLEPKTPTTQLVKSDDEIW